MLRLSGEPFSFRYVSFQKGMHKASASLATASLSAPGPWKVALGTGSAGPGPSVKECQRAGVLFSNCTPLDHRSERQIASMIHRLLKNAMR
jgi:hypothetical protein